MYLALYSFFLKWPSEVLCPQWIQPDKKESCKQFLYTQGHTLGAVALGGKNGMSLYLEALENMHKDGKGGAESCRIHILMGSITLKS